MEVKNYVRDVPNLPDDGILFKDITPLLTNPDAFQSAIRFLVSKSSEFSPRVIIGIASRGFVFCGSCGFRLAVCAREEEG